MEWCEEEKEGRECVRMLWMHVCTLGEREKRSKDCTQPGSKQHVHMTFSVFPQFQLSMQTEVRLGMRDSMTEDEGWTGNETKCTD